MGEYSTILGFSYKIERISSYSDGHSNTQYTASLAVQTRYSRETVFKWTLRNECLMKLTYFNS